jgi:CheY-like chemotaxis protein
LAITALTVGKSSAPLRITVVDDDSTMLAVFGDVLAEHGSVTTLPGLSSVTRLADSRPDLIVLGLRAGTDVAPWALLPLIRQEAHLRRVPVIVCTVDVAADLRAGRLSAYAGVQALEMPFDVEVIQGLVRRMVISWPTTAPRPATGFSRGAARLAEICPHGFANDSVGGCGLCLGAAGSGFALARGRSIQ